MDKLTHVCPLCKGHKTRADWGGDVSTCDGCEGEGKVTEQEWANLAHLMLEPLSHAEY